MTHVPICCQVCKRCGDEQVEIVQVLLGGAGADLLAADARYYMTHYQRLISERSIKVATRRSPNCYTFASEVAVEVVVSATRADTHRV